MTDGWRRAVHYLLFTASFAWPLDLLQYIPWVGLTLLGLAGLFLTAALVASLTGGERFGVPFEILAPAGALAIVVGADALSNGAASHRGAAAALLLLVLTTHFARTQEAIRAYVWASVLGGILAALLTALAPFLGLVPTAYSPESGVTLTFASSMSAGIHILLMCALCAVYVAAERRYSPVQRAVATGGLVLFAIVLVGRAVHWFRDAGRIFVAPYPEFSPIALAGFAIALWLLARILAKAEVQRRQNGEPAHWLWWGIGLGTVFVLACGPLTPRAYHGLLLGFAAGYALPERAAAPVLRWPVLGSAVVLLLAFVNLFAVFPENTRDQRQYDAIAQEAFDAGAFPRLMRHLAAIDRHAPHERRTHLWRAYTALALGLPNWGSYEFAAAVEPPTGAMLLQPPSERERQDFLVLVRDASASMREERAVCAYERVLIACGEEESALYSLRLETGIALTHANYASAAPFAAIAAMVLGAPDLEDDLADWTANDVLTLLVRWGTTLEAPPPKLAGFEGPILLAAQRDLDTLVVRIQIGDTVYSSRDPIARIAADELSALQAAERLAWTAPRAEEDTRAVRFHLEVRQAGVSKRVGTATCRPGGAVRFALAPDLPVVPFRPALRLYLPE